MLVGGEALQVAACTNVLLPFLLDRRSLKIYKGSQTFTKITTRKFLQEVVASRPLERHLFHDNLVALGRQRLMLRNLQNLPEEIILSKTAKHWKGLQSVGR